MRKIVLHGELGEKFIKEVTLGVTSIKQIFSLLNANFPGFYSYIASYKPGFHIRVGDVFRGENNLLEPLAENETLHIIPAVMGSGKIGTILLGAALIYITAGAGASVLAGWGAGATTVSAVSSIGVGLVLSGISALLFKPPKTNASNVATQSNNKFFNGVVNLVGQGDPVSIGYGTLLVGSSTISAGIIVTNT